MSQSFIGSLQWLIQSILPSVVIGTPRNDVLSGRDNRNDIMIGGRGDDHLHGLGGHDQLFGGAGNDRLDGGAGNDVLDGGAGDDQLIGGSGNDLLYGGSGNDVFDAGSGNDNAYGSSGRDVFLHRVSENVGSADFYDGAGGSDTLVLQLTRAEWMATAVQNDIARFLVSAVQQPTFWWCLPNKFQFKAFNLTVESIENLKVVVDGVELDARDEAVVARNDSYAVGENGTVSGQVLANDSVPDLVKSVSLISGPAKGILSFQPDGSFSYSAGTAFDWLKAGQTATISFIYEVVDADGDSGTATATITILGSNDVASITGVTTGSMTEDVSSAVSGTLNVADVDTGEAAFRVPENPSGSYGSFDFNAATGAWTYTLDDRAQALTAGQTVEEVLNVTSLDGTATETITVTVTGTNDDAVITGDVTGSVTEDTAPTFSGTLSVADVDTGEAKFQTPASLSGAYGSFLFDAATGVWSYTLDDRAQALTDDQTVEEVLNVTSLDGTATETITVTVTGTNDDAVITGDVTGSVTEDTAPTFSGTLSVADVDTGEAAFKVPASLSGAYGSFIFDATGAWTYTLDDRAQALTGGQTVEEVLTVTSLDGTATQAITVTVTGTNDGASITGKASGSVTEDTAPIVSGTLSVADVDTGEAAFKVPASLSGAYGSFIFDATGAWTYTLDDRAQALTDGQTVEEVLNVTSLDGTASQAITVTVTGTNDGPSNIDLANLGNAGFRINGASAFDYSGRAVSSAGDVNGDGYDDIIIGAFSADPSSRFNAGSSYVLFGKPSGFETVDLGNLGSAGFRIDGAASGDLSGYSVSSAGDVNGDGYDDLIVGAVSADPSGRTDAGSSYVVFGKASGFGTVTLANLGGAGFRIDGAFAGDTSGRSVASAGDVNGDGFDDVIIGADLADTTNRSDAGSSYVVFGKAAGFITVNLANLGSAGFRIDGASAGDASGRSVASAGDVNGDGFDDLIVGAEYADPSGKGNAGSSYVVFGKASGFVTVDLANLGGAGFRIKGAATGDASGYSASTAGDVNGDGFDDLIVGAYRADPIGRSSAGSSYVVFGKGSGLADVDLANLGTAGFEIVGAAYDYSGVSVSSAGDVNGDGYDDLIVGAYLADPSGRSDAGSSYVVFGKASDFGTVDLANLGSAGFRIDGDMAGSYSGYSVSSAGDVNGDGYDDLIVGAPNNDPSGKTDAGASYVLFGGTFGASTTPVYQYGTNAAEILHGSSQDDILYGNGGADILKGGAGNDRLAVASLQFQQVDGGTGKDTLILNSGPIVLDLTTQRVTSLNSIEAIDFRGSSAGKTLRLDQQAVFDLTEERSDGVAVITVRGTSSDAVQFASGLWVGAGQAFDNGTFNRYVNGAAEVRVQAGVAVSGTGVLDLANLGSSGFGISGAAASDHSGSSVSAAGDVNGDGYDDLIVGAFGADLSGKVNAGSSYVVFGKASGYDTVDLANLGSAGFRIDGAAAGDNSGYSVSSAGDVNGDGYDDIIIGAFNAAPSGKSSAGSSYVVFGKAPGFGTVELANLGSDGFRIDGAAADQLSGLSVSAAGDVNGDGYDDIIVGAYNASPSGKSSAGSSYVVFGKPSGFDTVNLANLGSAGFRIDGAAAGDNSGHSVSSAGDVNGDGYDDIIVGAYGADPSGKGAAGSSYVVFGKALGFGMVDLANLGSAGFRIDGAAASDQSGLSVSSAGDVNGDGYDDLIVGARFADPSGKEYAGSSYVVFGKASDFGTVDLANLGSGGFRIDGAAAFDYSGSSVSAAGDVNGDGYDDLIVGVAGADLFSKLEAGSSYVVFGKASGFGTVDLANLGSAGFRIDGAAAGDFSGDSVSAAGDVNGDGFDDVIVGARNADPAGKVDAGSSYVIFGDAFGASTAPISLTGTAAADNLHGGIGNDVLSGAGGDDLLIGGNGADRLAGGLGNDHLRLGGGADIVVFGSAAEGVDRIDDFVHGEDRFEISASGFGSGLVAGASITVLSSAAPLAASLSQTTGYMLYDMSGPDAGSLYFDATGGSASDAIKIAELSNVNLLQSSDFNVTA